MGNDDDKVLSQADVDALVALVPDKPRAAAPAISAKSMPADKHVQPSASEPVRTSAPAYQSPAPNAAPVHTGPSSEVIALQKTVADLTKTMADLSRQVGKFANIAQRLDLLEEKTGRLAQLIQHTSHNEQPSAELAEQITDMQIQLQELSAQLNHRHELREDFQCAHCKSKGTMAILTKCTSCGQERWFGWWPKKKNH